MPRLRNPTKCLKLFVFSEDKPEFEQTTKDDDESKIPPDLHAG
jgi:hypothetical protein